MDWKADGNHPLLACGWHLRRIYRGRRNFPRLFRRILDGIHRDAVINYHSFVRRSLYAQLRCNHLKYRLAS